MKKLFFIAIATIVAFASCNQEQGGKTVREVYVTPEELTIGEGNSETLEYSVVPESAMYTQVVWSSSNKEVATVSRKGIVTAVSAGTCTITCKVDDVEGYCDVTVTTVRVPVTGVSISQERANVAIGETLTLTATVEPEKASDQTVAWSSSNESVAKVDKDGVVTGLSRGTATIKATTNDGAYTAECEVKVSAPVTLVQVELPDNQWSKNTYPVFSTDGTTAYIVTLSYSSPALRQLIAIDLTGSIAWQKDLTNTTTGWAGNGGDICVNPSNGDIYVYNQCEMFCIKKDGTQRWSYSEDPTVPTTQNGFLVAGCGPAMSNDNSVVFVSYLKKLIAIDAATGEKLASADITSHGSCQFAVYGENKIVYHENNKIHFFSYADKALTEDAVITSGIAKSADITSCSINADATKVYFYGEKATECVNLGTKTVDSIDNFDDHGKGYRWTGSFLPNGNLVCASVYNPNEAAIVVYDTTKELGAENGVVAYNYSGINKALNFEGIGVGVDGNMYAFINDFKAAIGTQEATKGYFIRIVPTSSGYDMEIVKQVTTDGKDTYQGCFGYCGNTLVAVAGQPGVVNICTIDEDRAATWGNGGNPQGTKNANQIK